VQLKVINPNGVHCREIKGLDVLQRSLPNHWFGYASFELIGQESGEIDLIICADDRLILVEIKDWNVPITDNGHTWTTPFKTETSPVIVSNTKARKLATKLKKNLHPDRSPFVDHCVLFTGTSKRSDLNEDTRQKVFDLNHFKKLGGKDTFQKCFPDYKTIEISRDILKQKLDKFFSGSNVQPLKRLYNGYRAEEDAKYVHPQRIYSEYFANLEGVTGFRALLRIWNFEELGKVNSLYLNKENFKTIAFREENAIGYLNVNRPELSDRHAFLEPISNEGRESVTLNFFELYKLPPNLTRLKEALRKYGDGLKEEHRISIARLLLHHFSELHDLGVAHRDIGEHCIWVNIPDKVSLSGFATSSFPEQNTITQISNTIRAGTGQIPEELQNYRSDNFKKDVFLLGTTVHQILFGKKPEVLDDVPIWQEPTSSSFKEFWGWFERSLEWDPVNRFPDAKVAFEEFQRCSRTSDLQNLCEDDFREFQKKFPPMPGQAGDEIIRGDYGASAVVFRRGDRLFKLWSNAKFTPGGAAENFHLLDFLCRIQSLKSTNAHTLQEIIDFGMTSFGSYVELKWHEGHSLEEFVGNEFDDETGLAFIRSIIGALADLHRCKIYHGDLKPGNIILSKDNDNKHVIRLIDLVDFSSAGTERRTSAYLPPEGEDATTPGCDGYALKKIIIEFLFQRMPRVSLDRKNQIIKIFEDMLDPDGGIPDLKGILDELNALEVSDDRAEATIHEELLISMGGIENELCMTPDDRGLPITVENAQDNPECFVVRINDSALCLSLLVNAPHKAITKIWTQRGTIMDLTQSLHRKAFTLERPLRILVSHTDNISALNRFFDTIGLFDALHDRYRNLLEILPVVRNTQTPDHGVVGVTEIDEDVEKLEELPHSSKVEIPLDILWDKLLDAEESIVPVAVVTDNPVDTNLSDIIVFPTSEPSSQFDPQDDALIEVHTKDSEGQWRYYGNLDNHRSRSGRLAVIPKARSVFRPSIGTALKLVNKASRASYEKRLAAVQRILSRESVCAALFDYFRCDNLLSEGNARFASQLDLLDKYELNPVQKDALYTALKCSPLAMIQGPPGTGKTSVISAAVHYIATNYPTARILIVSQSHEAIDHATEQIVKRFRKQGDKPSLVRVGRRNAISDNLISFHSESLQGEYRERLRLSHTQRILPIGRRLGLSEMFTESFTILRSRMIPLLQQLGPNRPQEEVHVDSKLLEHIEKACRQLDPEFNCKKVPIESVCGLMEQRLVERHGETDQQAVNALRKVIDLALEWVQILESPGKLDRFYVGSCQIVTGTCVGVGRRHLGIEDERFDCVIIDEAARCGPGDLAVASQVAHQVILVGDHKQLPPFLEKDIVQIVAKDLSCSAEQVERSDFQRMFESLYAKYAGRTLNTQYRMREPIGRLVSECFYPDTSSIETGRTTSAECYDRLPASISRHVTWIDSGVGGEERVPGGFSFVNNSEIDLVIQILEEIDCDTRLVESLIDDATTEGLPAAIGIIAAYKAQADAIEKRIWVSSLSSKLRQTCKVGTVDSYQGKENPVVIFSAVRCNPHEDIGFTRSWERINVSLSRARERLVIVGSWNFWESAGDDAPLGKVVHYIASRLRESDDGYARIYETLETK
jgi:serine/threonine protein kinase